MHELTISPHGHLLVRESSLESSPRIISQRLLDAFTASAAQGMLYSATHEMEAALPPSFDFAR